MRDLVHRLQALQEGRSSREASRTAGLANAERPNAALFIVSGFLSNPAKDYLHDYELNNRPPFRIKYWERPVLSGLPLAMRILFVDSYSMWRVIESEIIAAEEEFLDRVWYNRKLVYLEHIEEGIEKPAPKEDYGWHGESYAEV